MPQQSGQPDEVTVKLGPQTVRLRASAPATGEGEVVPDRLTDTAEGIWMQGFTATEGRWNASMQCHVDVPDIKSRLKTLELWLAYRHGLPIQRQVRLTQGHVDRHAEMLEMARTAHGRSMLLAIGAIDANWLTKYLPGDTAGDTRP